MYCFESNAALFPRTAAIVGDRSAVLDGLDVQTGGLQSRDRAFASSSRSFDSNIDLLHAEFHRFFSTLLGSHLAGKGGAFATPFESAGTGTGPTKCFAFGIRDCYGCIVESRADVHDTVSHISSDPFLFRFRHPVETPLCSNC